MPETPASAEPRSYSPERDIHTAEPPLRGKRILVTGGTTGIGRALAALLAADGARVFVFGRHAPELRDALDRIRDVGGVGEGMVADQALAGDVDRVFAAVDQAFGGVDAVVINAAISSGKLAEAKESDWRYVVETNLAGYIAVAQEAVWRLDGRDGDPQIVLVGSISADAEGRGSPIYAATKGGVRAFAKALRKEVAGKGIRVSLVEPGTVGTDMHRAPPSEQRARIHRHEILRAEDIAVAIRYILTQPPRCTVTLLRVEPRLQA
ncbi:MAG: SDR family oxidoreductase [Pseudomonadota bacterium]